MAVKRIEIGRHFFVQLVPNPPAYYRSLICTFAHTNVGTFDAMDVLANFFCIVPAWYGLSILFGGGKTFPRREIIAQRKGQNEPKKLDSEGG